MANTCECARHRRAAAPLSDRPVLAVVLLVVDAAALDVLCALDALELAPADRAVGEGSVLHPVHVILAALEASGLAPSQRTRLDALVDALLLAILAAVNDLLVGIGECGGGGAEAQRGGGSGQRQ